MSQPLTDAINALTTYANEITGQSDTTLSDAVESLVDGYGGGSGGNDSLFLSILDRSVVTIDSEEITKLGKSALNGCSNLVSINLPNLTQITGEDSISYTGLTTLYLPNLTSIVSKSIINNSNLLYLILPKCTSNGWHMYRSHSSLLAADFTDVPGFGTDSFNGNSKMSTLIIRKTDSIATLANIHVFSNCPFASNGTGGILYVPESLISSYQSATHWSTILGYTNNQIKSIESTHTDPNASIDLTLYYADGTPIPSD